jgi:two-component system sensor histidine kinase QseC
MGSMGMTSIRRLMLVSLIAAVSLVTIVAASFSYRAGLQEAGELFDAKLAHSARVLMSLVDASLQDLAERGRREPLVIEVWHGNAKGEGTELAFPTGHAYETKLAFQVRDAEGRLLLRSDSGPSQPLAPLRSGYADLDIGGRQWRTFSLRSPSGMWYQAGEASDIRAEIAEEIAFGTLLPLLVALPLLAALVWAIVTWSLRDLRRISAEIGERAPERMSPLRIERVPMEIERMVSAVNSLLARLQTALARERRFTAYAAHELRTPIAALKVHADNLRTARNDTEADESRQQLDRGIERIERLVAQLLTLNRVEPDGAMLAPVPIDLDAIVRQQVEALRPLTDVRRIALEAHISAVRVLGDGPALESLVRNLFDNALRYTPEGGRVRIVLDRAESAATLCVDDSGPGIPPDARERVFERFHREPGSGVEGSGLGLSIVREVLALHRGTIQLDTAPELGGLRVRIVFPT